MSSQLRLTTADMTQTLVLEINGEDSPQNKAQRGALDLWVNAVNAKGVFAKRAGRNDSVSEGLLRSALCVLPH